MPSPSLSSPSAAPEPGREALADAEAEADAIALFLADWAKHRRRVGRAMAALYAGMFGLFASIWWETRDPLPHFVIVAVIVGVVLWGIWHSMRPPHVVYRGKTGPAGREQSA